MSNPHPARIAPGTPEGGRFAPDARAEASVGLDDAGPDASAEDQKLNDALSAEIAAYQAANSRIQLLSAKLTARAILREYPKATHLSMKYSDQTFGELMPNEVLDANGDAIDDSEFGDELEDADIGGLVGNLTEHGDWTVCRDYATEDDRRRGQDPLLNLAAAAALDTDQIAASTGIKTVSEQTLQATPAPIEDDDDDDHDDDAICLCDAVAADRRPYRNCPIHSGARAVSTPAEKPAGEQPPASPFETSGAQRTTPAVVYKESNPAYRVLRRAALTHMKQFQVGDVVVVTDEHGSEHFAKIRSDRLSDGQFGSPESRTLGASLGSGKYTFDVTAHRVAIGQLGIRKLRAEAKAEFDAAEAQFDAAEAANVVRQQQRINQANSRLTELGLPQVGKEAVAWAESDFPVRGRVHDVSADGRTVSIVRDGHAGTSQLPAAVIAPAAP